MDTNRVVGYPKMKSSRKGSKKIKGIGQHYTPNLGMSEEEKEAHLEKMYNYVYGVQEKGEITMKLNHLDDPLIEQDTQSLEFFLNTSKPVVSIDGEVYYANQSLLDEYPSYTTSYHEDTVLEITLAKDKETLKRFIATLNLPQGEGRLRELGKLYGFPKTAVHTFVEEFRNKELSDDRVSINYYGLQFIGMARDLDQIGLELLYMYGKPLQ